MGKVSRKTPGLQVPESTQVQDSVPIQNIGGITVYADGTRMQAATAKEDRYEGVCQIVAAACDVDNRRAGGEEYYAAKYPAFIKLSEREHEAKQRAAVIAAADED